MGSALLEQAPVPAHEKSQNDAVQEDNAAAVRHFVKKNPICRKRLFRIVL